MLELTGPDEPYLRKSLRVRKVPWKLRSPWLDVRPDGFYRKVKRYDPVRPIPEKLENKFRSWMEDSKLDNIVRKTVYAYRNKAWFQTLLTPSYWTSDEVCILYCCYNHLLYEVVSVMLF